MQYKQRIEGVFMLRPLAIDPAWGYSVYANYMDAFSVSDSLALEVYRRAQSETEINYSEATGKAGVIAEIQFKGPMIAEGGLCTRSIDSLCNQIVSTSYNSKVKAMVVRTHSGGGEVFAAQRLGNAIIDARSRMPVVGGIDGLCASGAYWALSQCTEVVAYGNVCEIGSLGVVLQLDKEWIEYMRENYIGVYANGSERKHEDFKDIIEGNFEALKKRSLDPIRAEFRKIVRSSRSNINEEVFTGAMFQAREAKKMGLIDHIGDHNTAISRAITLANKRRRKSAAAKALEHVR